MRELESVFNGIKDFLIIINLENKIEFCNDSVLKILNYEKEELIGKEIHEFTTSKYIFNEEISIRDKEGSYIKFNCNIINNIWSGKECRFLILENVKNESYQDQVLEVLLNKISLMVWIKDLDGTILYINKYFLDKLGLNSKDIVGTKTLGVYSEDIVKATLAEDKSLIENKNHIIRQQCIKDGSELRWIKINKSVILDYNKEARYILGIAEEITEAKNNEERNIFLEQENEADKIMNEFLNNVSHEFKTPINVVLSTTQLLENYVFNNLNELDEERFENYLRMIKNNSYRILRLVNNLIDITSIETGYYGLSLGNYNIISIVENIVDSVSQSVEQLGGEIIFDTKEEERIMSCDRGKIERIILNLISNSIKYRKEKLKILVSVNSSADKVIISVKDNGIGIDENRIDSIFDKFVQVDKSLSRKKEGSGIGLTLVKALVEMHCGNITVSSKLGKGTEFIISLPVKLLKSGEESVIGRNSIYNSERYKIEFSDIYFG